jgi:hypothetical protein
MQKTPPSDEVLNEIANVVRAAMAGPDEEVLAIAAHVIVEGPNGPLGRSVVQPPEAADAVLRIIRNHLEGREERTWDGE